MESPMFVDPISRRRSRNEYSEGMADDLHRPMKRPCLTSTPPSPHVLFFKYRSNRVLLVDRNRLQQLSKSSGSKPLHFQSFSHAQRALAPIKSPNTRAKRNREDRAAPLQLSRGDRGFRVSIFSQRKENGSEKLEAEEDKPQEKPVCREFVAQKLINKELKVLASNRRTQPPIDKYGPGRSKRRTGESNRRADSAQRRPSRGCSSGGGR